MSQLIRENIYLINGRIKIYKNEKIGSGLRSEILVGKYNSRVVAVKITNVARKEQLEHERNHLLRCSHDNILRFYGSEILDNKLYIALERCQGTLEDLIQGKYTGPSVVSTKEILSQIADGLQYLHDEMSIVHCDIRPISFFISKPLRNTNETAKMKIARFGQSIRYQPPTREDIENGISSDTSNPIEGRDPASLAWMDPILFLPEAEFYQSSDVFSFGLVCGYLATGGDHPFGKTEKERVENLKEENYNPVVFASLDPCLLDMIERTIVIDSRRRYTMKTIRESHPYFWTDKKSLDYLVTNFNDYINDKKNPTLKTSLDNIDAATRDKILNINWRNYLQTKHPQIDALADKSYDGTSLYHLLRFIRNKSEHYAEMDQVVKQILGPKPEAISVGNNYFQFWAENFPHLMIHIWREIEKKPQISVN